MSEHVITDLKANVGDKEILKGVSLTIRSGEVHAVMGPNGSGKSTLSHVITGKPGYQVTGGSVTLDGVDLLGMAPWERAKAGLFLAMQYPTEVPGVSLEAMLSASAVAAGRDELIVRASIAREAERIGLVSLCVEENELEAKSLEIAERLVNGAPNAIRWTKYALNNWLRQAGPIFDTSLALEFMGFTSPEVREGISAFREKRSPEFDPESPL